MTITIDSASDPAMPIGVSGPLCETDESEDVLFEPITIEKFAWM